ncbi:Pfs domain protein [Fusarium beomiforme]|uniref:Pfs domain protein n=1 Tax=Fusarium beomiforme TaxID=44412 RepID=A0A9P5AJV2_9HYPO|nr:Pfs domain protein [Fusarium beomiforme]
MPKTAKLQPIFDSQLSELKLGGTEIRCRYLRSSKWGVLARYHDGGRKQPAWILYLQLDIQQPADNKLKYAKMSLDFESEAGESEGVIVTEYYGPKHVRGPLETRTIHYKAGLVPEVGADPFSFKIGHLERESTQEKTERWHFDAMSKPGRVGDTLFRRIDWTITEARHALDPSHNPKWKLGVVLTHDGRDFRIHPDISISFINANRVLHLFPKKQKRTTTKVEPPKQMPEDLYNSLDAMAISLQSDLLNENLKGVATANQD